MDRGVVSVSATAEYQTLNWSDSGNWSAGVPGSTAGITNADTAVFTGPDTASFLTVLTPANLNIANITFDATANLSNDWGWRIGQSSGPAILLTDGGTIQTTAAVACNTNQISAPLVLTGTSYTFTSNAPDQYALVIAGGVSGTTGFTTLMLNGTTGSDGNTYNTAQVTGPISDGTATSVAVNMAGPGAWIISGTNTYSGGTTVNGGILVLQGGGTFSGGITINAGAQVQVNGSDASFGAANNTVTINGGSIRFYQSFATNSARAFVIGTGGAAIDTDTFTSNGTTIGGNISGAGTITAYGVYGYGSSILTLGGNNSGFSGGVNVSSGGSVLTLSGSASSGTGLVNLGTYYNSNTLNLLSDTSTTFITSNVQVPGYATTTINVDQVTSAGSNQTLTLNAVTTSSGGTLNITSGHGYSLGMGTLTAGGSLQLNPTMPTLPSEL